LRGKNLRIENTKEAVVFCGKCGKEIEENAKFCPYCGQAVPATEKVKPVKKEAAGADITPVSATNRFPQKTRLVLAIAVIVICAAGVLIFVLSKPKEIPDNGGWFDKEEIAETGQAGPTEAETLFERGKMFFDRGDYETAIADFSEAIRMDPNMAKAYRLRGSSLIIIATGDKANFERQTQSYDRAIADLTQAIRLDPNDAKAYYARGTAYAIMDNNDKAVADYTQAIRLDPNDAAAYYARGTMYDVKKEYGRAVADFEAALRIDPNHAGAKQSLEEAR
jgi:tetratricopeptide (TPR) repeat protein